MSLDNEKDSDSQSEKKPKQSTNIRETNDALGVGLQIAVSIVFFSLGGYWLDKSINTFPLFLIIGIAFGMIGMMVLLVKISNPQKK
ncbi:MAG: AtpZ/AtpI family protein [Chloroherpetonaceae bacterium]|nr:AtpZ/AtpI family protein [Chloroherpetonaceae bacterium]